MLHTIISGIDKLAEDTQQKLETVSTVAYLSIDDDSQLAKALENSDIFWFRLNHRITSTVLENSRCKYIVCAATGLDHIDIDACDKRGIKLISLKGESEFLKEVRATAEHTLGLLLALIRKTKNAFLHVEKGEWNRYQFQGSELYRKKVGVLGMGRLGKIISNYYLALGMNVYYYDITEQSISNNVIRIKNIDEFYKEIDVLSIHLPYNLDTHNFIDSKAFSKMKKNIMIVNTARGGVINETDLLESLAKGLIGGYATDVLFGEPNIGKHPLVSYAAKNENIIITPHIAGNTIESIEKTEAFVLQKLLNDLKEM